MLERITRFALDRPKTVISLAVLLTVLFGLQFPRITIGSGGLRIRGFSRNPWQTPMQQRA